MTQTSPDTDSPLKMEMRTQARQVRTAFLGHIRSPEFWADMETDPRVFHEALDIARDFSFVHYTRIATVMGMKDPSAVSRWFATGEGRKTPEWVRRQNAAQALIKIVENDLQRLSDGKDPVGHLSMKEYDKTEVKLFDLTEAGAGQAA